MKKWIKKIIESVMPKAPKPYRDNHPHNDHVFGKCAMEKQLRKDVKWMIAIFIIMLLAIIVLCSACENNHGVSESSLVNLCEGD